jgi:hypothetical protein
VLVLNDPKWALWVERVCWPEGLVSVLLDLCKREVETLPRQL